MLNPRPAYPFLLIPIPAGGESRVLGNTAANGTFSFRSRAAAPNRVCLRSGVAGPARTIQMCKTGARTFRLIEFSGPATVKSSWTLTRGIICKWEGPDFDAATGNDVAIETLELVHEGLS